MNETKGLKVTKGTVVRTVMMIVVLVNLVLKALGHDIIRVDESSLAGFIECGVNAVTLVLCFWKNNSFSEKAKTADIYLEKLRAFGTDEVDELLTEVKEDM